MARQAAKPSTPAAQPHEEVDPAVYDGWDFERINAEARRIRRLEREKGHDAVISTRRASPTVLARRQERQDSR